MSAVCQPALYGVALMVVDPWLLTIMQNFASCLCHYTGRGMPMLFWKLIFRYVPSVVTRLRSILFVFRLSSDEVVLTFCGCLWKDARAVFRSRPTNMEFF